MARRRKSSTAEDLMDLVAMLPWWAGVALALVSYWVLHGIATRPLPQFRPGQAMADAMTTSLWQGLATAGQYVLPIICIAGALVSFIRRRQRHQLFETASAGDSADVLQNMSWQEFELLVGEGFRRRGYNVRENGGGGADGGVDLVLTQGGEKFFVQCKQWKAFKVSVTTVRELYGVMAANGAAGGFVVTSGQFTRDSLDFANGRNIQLIDGPALMKLLREARAVMSQTRAQAMADLSSNKDECARISSGLNAAPPAHIASVSPDCPASGRPMVHRVAKRGTMAGKDFWGCSRYQKGCRGTREFATIDELSQRQAPSISR